MPSPAPPPVGQHPRPVRPAVGRLPLTQRMQVRVLHGSPTAGVAHPGPSCGLWARGGQHTRKAVMGPVGGHDVIQCALSEGAAMVQPNDGGGSFRSDEPDSADRRKSAARPPAPPTDGCDVVRWWHHLDGVHPLATRDTAGRCPARRNQPSKGAWSVGSPAYRLTHPKGTREHSMSPKELLAGFAATLLSGRHVSRGTAPCPDQGIPTCRERDPGRAASLRRFG